MNYKGKTAAIMVKCRTGDPSGTRATKDKYTAYLNWLLKSMQDLHGQSFKNSTLLF